MSCLWKVKLKKERCMERIIILVICIFSFLGFIVESTAQISRSISNISLGMEIKDFRVQFPIEEITDPQSLKKGDRIFVFKKRTRDIEAVSNSFYGGKLYKIEVFYSLPYSKEVSWRQLAKGAVREYGPGKQIQTTQGPVMMWGDEATSVKLERRPQKKGEYRYVLSLLDNVIYLSRGEKCESKPHKI